MSLRPRVPENDDDDNANTTTMSGLLVVQAVTIPQQPVQPVVPLMPQPRDGPYVADGRPSQEERMRMRRRSALEVPQPQSVPPPLAPDEPPTPVRPPRSSSPRSVQRRGPQPRRLLEGPIVDKTLKRGTIVSASVATSGKLLDFVVNLSGGTMIQGIKEFQGAIGTSWIFAAGGLNLLKNHNDGSAFDSDTRIILRVGVALLVKRVLKIEGLGHIRNLMSFFSFVRTASVFVTTDEASPVYDVMNRIANVPLMVYNAVALMLSNALPQNIRELVAIAIDEALGTLQVVQTQIAKQVDALDIMAAQHMEDIEGLPAPLLQRGEAFRILKDFGQRCV